MEREIEIIDPVNSHSHVAKVHYWYEDEGEDGPDYRLHMEIVSVNVSEEDGETEREVEPAPWMQRAARRSLESELDMELRVDTEERTVSIY